MLRKICRVRRTHGAVEEEWGSAVGKCCAAGRNARYCSAEVMDVQLGQHRQVGRAPVIVGEGLDGIVW